MVKLLAEQRMDFRLPLDDLKSLTEVGITGGKLAQRSLNQEHVETLVLSDPLEWPPLLVTKTNAGYVILDGYHRKAAAIAKKLTDVKVNCKSFKAQNDVIEATFQANLKHGLKSSAATRSDYAWWLHTTYPHMEQKEIAERVGITQPSVSIAISRREHWEQAAQDGAAEPTGGDARQEQLLKTCRSLTRDAVKMFDQLGDDIDERELVRAIHDSIKKEEDREKLARIVRLLQESLKPPKAVAAGKR